MYLMETDNTVYVTAILLRLKHYLFLHFFLLEMYIFEHCIFVAL